MYYVGATCSPNVSSSGTPKNIWDYIWVLYLLYLVAILGLGICQGWESLRACVQPIKVL